MIAFGLLDLATAMLVALTLCAPGLFALRRSGAPLWTCVAGGFSSAIATLLVTAVLSELTGFRSIWLALPALACVTGTCFLACRSLPRIETAARQDKADGFWPLLVPALAAGVSLLILSSAVTADAQGITLRDWFRSDMFKHLGHINALLAGGLPPHDIFGGGEPLAYYWLYYIVPALGVQIHGTPAAALCSAIVVQTFLFWFLVYGLLRELGASPAGSAAIALIVWLSPTMEGIATLQLAGWDWRVATEDLAVGGMYNNLMGGSTLFRIGTVIPQHELTMAGLLAWFLLYGIRAEKPGPAASVLAHVPLVALGAISTLFGAICLCVYGFVQLFDRALPLRRRMLQIAATGLAALALLLLLGIIDIGPGHSSLNSPLFADPVDSTGYGTRSARSFAALVPLFSLLILPGVVFAGLAFAKRKTLGPMAIILAGLVLVGLLVMLGTNIFLENRRVAHEMQIRASLLVALGIGLAYGMAWIHSHALPGGRKLLAVCLGVALLTGLATPAIDVAWHLRSGHDADARIPADDLAVLQHIAQLTEPDSMVLQYPEPPLLAGGRRDMWAAVLGGRTVPASLRATDWASAEPVWAQMEAYYTQPDAEVPMGTDYIYLSRELHPQSYDRMRESLMHDPAWRNALCLESACLFARAGAQIARVTR